MPAGSRTGRFLLGAGAVLIMMSPLSAARADPVAPVTWTGTVALPPALGAGLIHNQDAEPGIAVTPAGQFWVSSNVSPRAGQDPRRPANTKVPLTGADIWTSIDHGLTYRWVGDPFATTDGTPERAGGDTDVAVAPEKNANGYYDVYVTSLWVGASSLAWSGDGGQHWTVQTLGGVPAQDRPWLAADGPCTVYLVYHEVATNTPLLNRYDVCTGDGAPAATGTTLDPVGQTSMTLSDFPGRTDTFNKPTVDTSPVSPYRHRIYVPFAVCAVTSPPDLVTNLPAATCPNGMQYAVAVSGDGGATFSDYPVVNDPTGTLVVWAATIATDSAGTVYFTWTDESNAWLVRSTDGGRHWSDRVRLNPPGTAAVYPTVAAGEPGRVDVAWYGADRAGDANTDMGTPGAADSAAWNVQLARSTDAGHTFTTRPVSGTIHRGNLCTHGTACSTGSDFDPARNLLDNFGLAISPRTGHDAVVYTDDQPSGAPAGVFTAVSSEVTPLPPPAVPEAPAPALLAVAGVAALGAGLLLTRRRRA